MNSIDTKCTPCNNYAWFVIMKSSPKNAFSTVQYMRYVVHATPITTVKIVEV